MDAEPNDQDALPSAVNLPLLAEDVTFDISIKRAAPEERTATLEEKRATLTEKAAAAGEKRLRRILVLVALFAVLGLCLYEIFSQRWMTGGGSLPKKSRSPLSPLLLAIPFPVFSKKVRTKKSRRKLLAATA